MELLAIVRIKNLKAHKDDQSVWKGAVLTLVPTYLAFQDTLCLLITLGLIEGAFDVVKSWADILSIDHGLEGELLLPIKPEFLERLVFYNHERDRAVRSSWTMKMLRALGRAAGFHYGLTSFVSGSTSAALGYADTMTK